VPVTADADDGFTIGTLQDEDEIAENLEVKKVFVVVTYAQERFLPLMRELIGGTVLCKDRWIIVATRSNKLLTKILIENLLLKKHKWSLFPSSFRTRI